MWCGKRLAILGVMGRMPDDMGVVEAEPYADTLTLTDEDGRGDSATETTTTGAAVSVVAVEEEAAAASALSFFICLMVLFFSVL